MSNKTHSEFQATSDTAAFYALLCLIPIFVIVVTYGWGRILQPILPVESPWNVVLAYFAAVFLALAGVVLAKVIAADRVQLSIEAQGKAKLSTWMARCWAYLLVLLTISALGTARTIFAVSQASDVLSNELSQTGTELRTLQATIDAMLKTPEYDVRLGEYKARRLKLDSLVAQFEIEMEKVRQIELTKLDDGIANVDKLWEQFKIEVENPQLCGFGPAANQYFKALQDALP